MESSANGLLEKGASKNSEGPRTSDRRKSDCTIYSMDGRHHGNVAGRRTAIQQSVCRLFGILTGALVIAMIVSCATLTPPSKIVPEALVLKTQWPYETSDLKKDPASQFGKLKNGVRYVLKTNHTPKERVSMHLYVQAGSLAERPEEEGMAHFLEHMVFNGSEHFPPGEIVKYFQRIGMQFGPDANAHTGFDETVFDILLPSGDAKSISEGLLVLKDFAQGALLLPDEVEKEKGVVLAEKRSRDSVDFRTFKATLAFETAGTIMASRLPIGRETTIRSFNAQSVRDFYNAWYQPERLTVVMVGPFDQTMAQRLIEEQFGSLKPIGERRSLPDLGRFTHEGTESFYHFEKEAGNTTVSVENVILQTADKDRLDTRHRELERDLAVRIVQKRLDSILQDPKSVLTKANVSAGEYLRQFRYADISADCKPENWEHALSVIEQTLRQVLQFGFTPSELEIVKSEYIADLQQDVNDENTTDSKDLSREIMTSIGDWKVFQSPSQRKAMLMPLIEKATAEQISAAFRQTWAAPHRLVLVTGNVDITSGQQRPESIIASVFQKSTQTLVKAPIEKQREPFPYLSTPETGGEVASQKAYDDLGIEEVLYANGVRLLFKRTTFKENEVITTLSFGDGTASQPKDKPGLGQLTQDVVNESGFGKMDRIALENALAGKLAEISLHTGEYRFIVNGKAASNELETLFQLLRTFILDPAYRPEALDVVLKRFDDRYNTFIHSVQGTMRLEGVRFLAGGDNRFGWPTSEQMHQLSVDDIAQWFGRQLAHAPLELVVVGDFDKDKMLALAGRYFGTLEKREGGQKNGLWAAPVFPSSQSIRLAVDTAIDKALVIVSYPTDDFWDISKTRRLNTLADIFSERLRIRIREKLGVAYSPYAYNRAFRAYDGYGYLQAVFIVEPSITNTILSEVKQIANDLVEKPITEDELRRALDPTITKIRDLRQTNDYWEDSVLSGASWHPEQLSWARSIEKDYAAITTDEMHALARQYLKNDMAAQIVIAPEKSQAAQEHVAQ